MSGDDPTPDGAELLSLDGVTKTYGRVQAVDDLSLSIGGGQYHCLLGPNGSGKSTAMRLLLGLVRPTEGSVDRPAATVGCGFQQPNFYPGLTVRENIDIFAGLMGASDWDWNQTVVSELRLGRALDREAGDLSGGFARRLDLALALLKEPSFLLLDEPLGALDDVSQERLLAFLGRYAGDHTLLVSTHEITEFEPHVDRITVLHRGELVFDRLVENIDLDEDQSLQEYYVDTVLAREGISPEEAGIERD
jgi:ABC-2 type transport system ATP-binding protein